MIIGIPKEMKKDEYRVGAIPALVDLLVKEGHTVLIESGAGERIGFTDDHYREVKASVVPTIEEVYKKAELILKVKEPQRSEFPLIRRGQILFCYLHLVSCPEVLAHLIERKAVAIAFETVKDNNGTLPLLTPMSEVAGKLAIMAGARGLEVKSGGKGLMVGGLVGVPPAKVVILGGGVVGRAAASTALSLGADLTLLDNNQERLRDLDDHFGHRLKTLFATPAAIESEVLSADLVIGSVLLPGRKTPKLITESMIKKMSFGSVLVDVSIDQGGVSETSRLSSFSDPYYSVHGVVHYAVPNMPSACARSSSYALSNALTPYVLKLASGGLAALVTDRGFLEGVNVAFGHITLPALSEETQRPLTAPEIALEEAFSHKAG